MIEIYTDGSCRKARNDGGMGVYIPAWDMHLAVAQTYVTNNRMELGAIYLGLLVAYEYAQEGQEVCIVSDSRYALDSVFTWWAGWVKSGFKTKSGDVKNLELLKGIQTVLADVRKLGVKVSHRWVKGHSGNAGNEEADRLSNWRANNMEGSCYALAQPSSDSRTPLALYRLAHGHDLTERCYYPLLEALAERAT